MDLSLIVDGMSPSKKATRPNVPDNQKQDCHTHTGCGNERSSPIFASSPCHLPSPRSHNLPLPYMLRDQCASTPSKGDEKLLDGLSRGVSPLKSMLNLDNRTAPYPVPAQQVDSQPRFWLPRIITSNSSAPTQGKPDFNTRPVFMFRESETARTPIAAAFQGAARDSKPPLARRETVGDPGSRQDQPRSNYANATTQVCSYRQQKESSRPAPPQALSEHILILDTKGCQKNKLSLKSRRYVCQDCGRSFFRKSDLMRHIQIHLGIKPNVCSICGKQFIQRSALTVHFRVHTGEKPYHCPVCLRAFSDSSSLARHRRIHLRNSQVGHAKSDDKISVASNNFKEPTTAQS